MSSTVIAKNIQIGTSGTAANNFTLYQPASPDGTVRLGVGNSGATTSDVLKISATGFDLVGGYPAYQCRAWVNFTGSGTVTIRASGNVTSITDNGVGDFTVNFTNAMPDANYSMGATGEIASGTNYNVIQFNQNTAPTTSAVRLTSLNQSGGVPAVFDSARITISIFR